VKAMGEANPVGASYLEVERRNATESRSIGLVRRSGAFARVQMSIPERDCSETRDLFAGQEQCHSFRRRPGALGDLTVPSLSPEDGSMMPTSRSPSGTPAWLSTDVHRRRLASVFSTKADGLGIGLSLCRSIVEAHGRTLHLLNCADGAEVRFALPIAELPA
jgi:hypothetical protein